jgi:hypothetical protein
MASLLCGDICGEILLTRQSVRFARDARVAEVIDQDLVIGKVEAFKYEGHH